nr:hypothetical protein pKpn33002_00235 [Klebsiella pneumoniae]WCS71084.1 hypothetical protein OKNDNCAF_00306 [Klebsiella pneumoniae]
MSLSKDGDISFFCSLMSETQKFHMILFSYRPMSVFEK